jgi:hypothetical protein
VTSTTAPVAASDESTSRLLGEVLRDIARGGIAGAAVGIVIAGLGGRIVMRLAALIVPAASGAFTENGNRIGEITLSGSLGLILFAGLFFGLAGGTVWVVASPWIPWAGARRAILAAPIAVALSGVALVRGDNPDFRVLEHDAGIVALLLVLVAVAGSSIALLDGWLERRLPRPTASARTDAAYAIVTLAGGLLILPIVVLGYLAEQPLLGFALVGVGLATLAWWVLRMMGRTRRPPILVVAGRAALLAAVGSGVVELVPEVTAALGA